MKKNDKTIAVLGLWHLGLVYSTSLAKSGYKVFGFDLNKETINKLNSKELPIYEPNLSEYFKKVFNKNLFFNDSAQKTIENKDYIFITLDTPVNHKDEINLQSINTLFDLCVKYSSKETTIVISSQVPIGTTQSLIKKIKHGKVIYFPENLRLGNAIEDFLNPSRIILGANNKIVVDKFLKDFPIFKCEIIRMSIESAEMLKHALNSYLALIISFSSELSDLCEALGADASDVVLGLKSDPRVSPKAPINPGLGFAGGTLGRDIKTLLNISARINYKAKLLKAIYQVNQDRLKYLLKKIKKVYPNLSSKKIGILGLTYKPNTNTLRRSQSIELANLLFKEKAQVKGFDPAIKLLNLKSLQLSSSLEEFFKDLDLLILMTQWQEFKDIDPKVASALMKQKIIIDTKNFLNQKEFLKDGFKYIGVGK